MNLEVGKETELPFGIQIWNVGCFFAAMKDILIPKYTPLILPMLVLLISGITSKKQATSLTVGRSSKKSGTMMPFCQCTKAEFSEKLRGLIDWF